jgi:predicted dehydrogenase
MCVRWGLIGCGDIVRKRVAAAIQTEPHSKLQAACRRDRAKLADFCQEFDVPAGHDDALALLDSPDIDAVYIATPVSSHCPYTIAAAERGKHVLVEKPMALSVSECDKMVDACRHAGVHLGVAYYRPFYPVVERMRWLAASGEIGEMLSITAITSSDFRMKPNDPGYWRVIPELGGGGALMDIGSHRIDLFLRLGGPIRQVRALCGTVAAAYAAEDCASMVVQFDCGAHGHLQCYFGTTADVDEFSVLGTRGQLVSSPLNSGHLAIRIGGDERQESHPPDENLHAPLIADFATAIREQRPPRVSGTDGRAVNEVIERAYRDAAGMVEARPGH